MLLPEMLEDGTTYPVVDRRRCCRSIGSKNCGAASGEVSKVGMLHYYRRSD